MDDGSICFSPGAIALLGAIWLVIQGAFVTIFWLYVRSERAQIADAKARELEWKRLALRGVNEIIPPLVSVARAHVQDQLQELREPLEPR